MSTESSTKERVKKRNLKAMFNVYNKSFYKLPCQALKNLTSSHPGPDLDNNTSGKKIISKLPNWNRNFSYYILHKNDEIKASFRYWTGHGSRVAIGWSSNI